ncbi:MAG: thymidine kinase [Candidatus Cloacimonetes bacterium 4572_65]|nr:MAG: thymidine kinase [Candidatus Cloacimonetes bacterium 4572_65]
MNVIHNKTGWIEVICGGMFSGKTEELIRRIRRSEYAKQKVQIFKPKIDNRYEDDYIVSHSMMKAPSEKIVDIQEIWALLQEDTQVVAIDEVQFFDDSVITLCTKLADMGKRVIVAGLDLDYKAEPFGPIPKLLAIAEYVTKNSAICVVCGNPATRTQRLVLDQETILVGSQDIYEARCRNCHEVLD